MKKINKVRFESVSEWDNDFLALFPHRFDYIWANHPELGAPVKWKTESRHPLSDRLIQQGSYLYGVRFGAETSYCVLDIDISSRYHPRQDPLAIFRITAALEPMGLVSYLTCTSSYSGGLHLYFPFSQPQSSWQLAIALACLLENAGFKLHSGQLEAFPNPKPYSSDGNFSLFNAHRLPLQSGSYILNQSFQPIWGSTHTFVKQWQLNQQQNVLNIKTLKQILRQAKRKHFGISGKAEKFINDLNAEIELGWTGSGQTNRLLGRITMRAYIFHHLLSGGEPLKGKALVNEIVETARSLPGYQDWCKHQHEIEQRSQEWASCIENSHYFHFGETAQKAKSTTQDPELITAIEQSPSWNQQQSASTRDRIRRAIAQLLEDNTLPAKPTARFQALLKHGIGGASLYRHRDLWHPSYFEIHALQEDSQQVISVEDKTNWHSLSSLLSTNGGNALPGKDSGDRHISSSPLIAGNSSIGSDYSVSGESTAIQIVQPSLFDVQAQQEAVREATRLTSDQRSQIKAQASERRQVVRMQQLMNSGDPILMAEAIAWAQVNPKLLKMTPLQFSLLELGQSMLHEVKGMNLQSVLASECDRSD